ncbi:uncharacterized protein MELLADRAFT_123905 [Melampsora larici-populina 98AG31]|uniref:Secreted protein n=1 Tax=Melampsora larici-populina (strain 98AG31 / pathotype 3-4-7) TaxID=747676 RepID=F4S3Y5_MELLP|nr:uncharacterized protein MELLADRAFT_123905 [Melampsora larici-populina 98AG31]EGG00658.1 secreted protein [Melampsora larici-populina 98AG31]
MAQDSSGSHIVMWLPALAWVNFDMKGMGDLEWHSDTRPLHYFENIMPKAQTKLTPTQSPYGRYLYFYVYASCHVSQSSNKRFRSVVPNRSATHHPSR